MTCRLTQNKGWLFWYRNCRRWPWISSWGEIPFEHASPPSCSDIPSAITQMSLASMGKSYEWKQNQGRGCWTPFLLCCCLIRWCWLILCITSQWKEPSRSVRMGLKELKAMNYFLLQRAIHLYKLLPSSVPFWDYIPHKMSLWPPVLQVQTADGNRKMKRKKMDAFPWNIFHLEATTTRSDLQDWPLDLPLSKQGL